MTAEINSLTTVPTAARFEPIRLLLVRYADVWLMLALALITAAYCLQYDILRQPIPHDTTFHIYAAQQMLEGHAIYRDVAIIKAPLSDFAAAFAILVGRMLHISDVMATRILSLFSVMAAASVTYLAGRVLFHSRVAGFVAGLAMATWNFYGVRALTGPEPKEFLIVGALLSMIFIAQRRWLPAGIFAGLSTLAWQPALMVQAIAMGAAVWEPWMGGENTEHRLQSTDGGRVIPRSARDKLPTDDPSTAFELRTQLGAGSGRVGQRRAERRGISAFEQAWWVLLGFVIPFVFVVGYLALNGAVADAWNATIGANVVHFSNNQARVPLFQTVDSNLAEILNEGSQYCFSYNEYWLVIAGALGFVGLIGSQIVNGVRTRRVPINLNATPLILYGLGFTAFSLIDFDFCPDLLPLVPVIALGAGWLAGAGIRACGWLATKSPAVRATDPNGARVQMIAAVILCGLLVYVYWFDAWGYQIPGTTFLDQVEVANVAREYLQPGDRVQTFGNAIVPIELHMPNASKILHLGSKSGLGVLSFEEGGFDGMMADLERDPPRVITLARENRLEWTAPFYEWLDRHYEPGPVFGNANMRILIFKE